MATALKDLQLSLRQLWRTPVFTAVAVLTLGIGMGVNTVAFSVVNGVLFKRATFRSDTPVGRVATTPGGDESGYASFPEYERFVDATRGALDVAAEGRLSLAWRHDGTTDTAWVLFVSSNYFSIVDVRPIAGGIKIGDTGTGTPSVVVGERFWRTRLGAASLAGLTVRLNDTDVPVAGVLPESFTGPGGLYAPDVWMPLDDLRLFHTSASLRKREERWLFLIGRPLAGVTVPEVQGRLDAAAAAMAHDWPDTHRQRGARFRLFSDPTGELRGLRTAAGILMGIIGLVLLLACFNVANLLLARAVERERELGIRAAIGASPARLMRLVITEGFLISALAGLTALVLAWWTQSLVASFAIPIEEPQHISLSPDARVIGFTLLLIVIAGLLPGIWPALTAARADVARVLGSQGAAAAASRTPMRRWLVGAQIAGSTAFLATAALLAQSYGHLAAADLGFARDHLLVAEFEPAAHGYGPERSEQYVRTLLARTRALPGVTDVAIADRAPFFIGFDQLSPVSPADKPCDPDACPRYATLAVGTGYFRTMGVPLVAGREFGTAEAAEVIINQPLARQLWPDGRGLGASLRVGERQAIATVIGITTKTHTRGLDREQPTLYVRLGREQYERGLTLIARTAGPPELLARPFIDAAQGLDSRIAIASVKSMQQRMAVQLWPFRTVSWLFAICGVLALVLSTVGLAGVVIHGVNRRLREFGVRLSIGATPRDLVVDVLTGSARLLVPGLIAGTLLAASAARLVRVALVGVNPLNPATYLVVALLECAIVFAACVGPAIRAARVDPLTSLRAE